MCVPFIGWHPSMNQNRMSQILSYHLILFGSEVLTFKDYIIKSMDPLGNRFYCFGKYKSVYYDDKLTRILALYKNMSLWSDEQKENAKERRIIACAREKRWLLNDATEWLVLFTAVVREFHDILFFYLWDNNIKDLHLVDKGNHVSIKELNADHLLYLEPATLLHIHE